LICAAALRWDFVSLFFVVPPLTDRKSIGAYGEGGSLIVVLFLLLGFSILLEFCHSSLSLSFGATPRAVTRVVLLLKLRCFAGA